MTRLNIPICNQNSLKSETTGKDSLNERQIKNGGGNNPEKRYSKRDLRVSINGEHSEIDNFFQQLPEISNGSRYSRMDQVRFFKDCLPHILLGPFLNALTQITLWVNAGVLSCYYL